MINVWWTFSRGRWDEGLMIAIFEKEDRLWPHSMQFNEYIADPPPLDQGAIVIGAGTALLSSERAPEILERVKRYPWVLFCLFSDENRSCPNSKVESDNVTLWQMYKTATTPGYHVLQGWARDVRTYLRDLPRLPLAKRRLRWAFSGQVNHGSRGYLVELLATMEGGFLNVSNGFGQGLPREDYFRLMSETAISPCPSGANTPENFRFYEALEAGCLPICHAHARLWPTGCWWTMMLEETPAFPIVQDWDELPALMEKYQDDVVLQRDANKAGAWWIKYKRKLTYDLVDALHILDPDEPLESDCPVTVLIPTSPIPEHPSTEMIEEVIRRIRAYPELEKAEIIIMIDGLHGEQVHYAANYEEYKRRLIELCNWHPDFQGCLPLVFDEWSHQANMTREALKLVRTPYIFFVEHDTYPCDDWAITHIPGGEIKWANLIKAMGDPEVNVIQLAIFGSVDPEREFLYGEHRNVAGAPLMRTMEWCQRPHLAHTEWYRWMIDKFFAPDWRTMIEEVAQAHCWQRGFGFDVWEYIPGFSSDDTRSRHFDGRGDDTKYPMYYTHQEDPSV